MSVQADFTRAFTGKAMAPLIASALFAAIAAPSVLGEQIKLSTGEVMSVEIQSVSDGVVHCVHPVLGDIALKESAVSILPPATFGAPGYVPARTETDVATGAVAEEPVVPPKEWKFKFVLGVAGASGNTENANGNVMFTAVRENDNTKLAFDTGYFFASSNGDKSENRFTIGARHDWKNPGRKWFYFADLRYDWDEFQTWDSRLTGHVGVGYKLIEPPKLKLNLIGGIGFNKEFGSPNEDIKPEGLIGIEGQYDFAEKHSIVFSSVYYPDFSDIGEYRWVNNIAWSWLIDKEDKLSLTAGFQHEYQSEISAGRKHNDFRVYAGIAIDF